MIVIYYFNYHYKFYIFLHANLRKYMRYNIESKHILRDVSKLLYSRDAMNRNKK